MVQIQTKTDVDDFLRGANFMSASGGGDPAVEREQLYEDVADGLEIGWTPLENFAPDDHLFSVCYSGSIAPESFDPDQPVRVLNYGHSPHVYRVFFTIDETAKVVRGVHIRRGARERAAPGDLTRE